VRALSDPDPLVRMAAVGGLETVAPGQRYELATMGLAGRRVEVRFDPNDVDVPPRVFDDGAFVCDTRPLDLRANATGRRRRRQTLPEPVRDPVDAVQDLLDAHYGADEDDRGGAR